MKFSRIMKISINRVFRNRKRNLILGIPIVIIMILLLVINNIQYSAKRYIEKLENNIEIREIDGINYTKSTSEEVREKLQKIEHVDMVIDMYERHIYASEYCEQLKTEITNGYTSLKPINVKTCPEVIKGRQITEEDKYVIIVPDKICANGVRNDEYNNVIVEKMNIEEMYVNGESLIGNELTIEFQPDDNKLFEKSFKVIGVYDSEKYGDFESLYIPKPIVKEINKEIGHETADLFMKIIVDKLQNIQEVENTLIKEGLINKTKIQIEAGDNGNSTEEENIAKIVNLDLETQNAIKILLIFLFISSIVIFVILLIVTNLNKTYLSTTDIGILKVQGYNNKQIQKITIIENILVCLISFVVALFIFELLKIFVGMIGDYIIQKDTLSITINELKKEIFYLKKIPQKLNWIFAVVDLIILIIIVIINTFFTNKRILAKNIKELIKM